MERLRTLVRPRRSSTTPTTARPRTHGRQSKGWTALSPTPPVQPGRLPGNCLRRFAASFNGQSIRSWVSLLYSRSGPACSTSIGLPRRRRQRCDLTRPWRAPPRRSSRSLPTRVSAMLTIRAMSDGKGYSSRHLEHSDYYAEGERVVGRWAGRGAEMLGLQGPVRGEDFEALRQGVDPRSGGVLRRSG